MHQRRHTDITGNIFKRVEIGDVPRKLAIYTMRSNTRPDAHWLQASNLLKLTIFSQRQYNFQEQSLYQATRKKERNA
jgi:hypothetical protein